jgi:hypothetical protein
MPHASIEIFLVCLPGMMHPCIMAWGWLPVVTCSSQVQALHTMCTKYCWQVFESKTCQQQQQSPTSTLPACA